MNPAKKIFHIIYESKNVYNCLAAETTTHCNKKRNTKSEKFSNSVTQTVLFFYTTSFSVTDLPKYVEEKTERKKRTNVDASGKCVEI